MTETINSMEEKEPSKVKRVRRAKRGAPKKSLRQKYHRIFGLGSVRKETVDDMLSDGTAISRIAKVIQERWCAWRDIKPSTAQQTLRGYKRDIIDKKIAAAEKEQKKCRNSTIEKEALFTKSVDEELDVLYELVTLIQTQKKRINKMLARENSMPMLFNTLGREMKVLAGLLGQYTELSFGMGLIKKVPKFNRINGLESASSLDSPGRRMAARYEEAAPQIEEATVAFFKAIQETGEDRLAEAAGK